MARYINDILLKSSSGSEACILGNHAIVRGAIEAGLGFFSYYPGTPSSEIGDTFAEIAQGSNIHFECAINEKIAVETSYAACLAGMRSMCSMKHLGLMSAGDPISTIPYIGVRAGFVVVSAGDPSALTSPNEQDQRWFSKFLFYPVFDPATPEDALTMTRYAFSLSEEVNLPIMIRPTTRVCHTSGMVSFGQIEAARPIGEFVKDHKRFVPIPLNARKMRLSLTDRFMKLEKKLQGSPFFPQRGSGDIGIVAAGTTHTYCEQIIDELGLWDRVRLLKIGVYPIPGFTLETFFLGLSEVLVVEELTPFIEETLLAYNGRNRLQLEINGKLSGHFPQEFEYSPDLVEQAIKKVFAIETHPKPLPEIPLIPSRPPVLCAGCPHRASFYLVRKVFGKKTVYCNDIGCYTLGYGEPLDCCDVLLCMGSSISQASGIARATGKRTVAFIGDSTFFHSGIPALANAVQAKDQITVVILNNYVTAMTGFQKSPMTAAFADQSGSTRYERPLDIFRIVRGLGIEEVYQTDPFETEKTLSILKNAKCAQGVNVIIVNAPCVVFSAKHRSGTKTVYRIDRERCNECSLCVVSLGCPALEVGDAGYRIHASLCNGCAICTHICNHQAIIPMEVGR